MTNMRQLPDHELSIIISLIVFTCITWVAVAVRTYVRVKLTKRLGSDDYCMLVAQVVHPSSPG
jgi:hypothetical protein